ncbi:hypothetical protein XM38_014420 [Halomicronema hongdechloris C2206]|uniref:Uncharacterized protein n=2 Tax=Halomicronema hongdechloris TaxID=1209493 RepID=A0A1Z3HJN6_9CYAN|nr:hypothetical protein XM38_014420 [Halomicronema hongdechloris C2206]
MASPSQPLESSLDPLYHQVKASALTSLKVMLSSTPTVIHLEASDANPQTHHLHIRSSGAELKGQIRIDGNVVQSFNAATRLELTPYLTAGQTTRIELTGQYQPAAATVHIALSGLDHDVIELSGGGRLNVSLEVTMG